MISKKEELLKAARVQLQISGYNDLNFTEIADLFQISRSALFYHFSSKEQLVLAIALQAEREFAIFARRRKILGITHSLNLFLKSYYKYARSSSSLCLIGVFTFSYHSLPEQIKKIAGSYISAVLHWLEECFHDGKRTGEYNFPESVEAMAAKWIAILPGALQASRYLGEDYFSKVARELKNSLLLTDGDTDTPFLQVQFHKRFPRT